MNIEIKNLEHAHQWTHDGAEVLIIKCVNSDGSSSRGFTWPLTVGAEVHPATWGADATCDSGGLFGWPWGFGLGDGKEPDWAGKWIVFGAKPEDVVSLGVKCKAKAAIVRFVGDWNGTMQFILKGQMALVAHVSSLSKETHATGYSSASGATGYSSASSATGYSSASVVTGLDGRVRAGKFGCVALAWWNEKERRGEMRCREIGCGDGSDGKLKADTWYLLNEAGEFVEAAQ